MRLLAAFLGLTSALFFEMTEKETKCFIEELPDDTIVHGKYRTQVNFFRKVKSIDFLGEIERR